MTDSKAKIMVVVSFFAMIVVVVAVLAVFTRPSASTMAEFSYTSRQETYTKLMLNLTADQRALDKFAKAEGEKCKADGGKVLQILPSGMLDCVDKPQK